MWRKLKNLLYSFSTYTDLGPDFQIRQQVNEALRHRPALSLDQWFDLFWRPHGIAKSVVVFVYTHLEKYSGLPMGKVRPSDRLDRDLHLSLVCWFDWQMSLCEDFLQSFGVDLSDRLDLYNFSTVEEFVIFLNLQLLTINQV